MKIVNNIAFLVMGSLFVGCGGGGGDTLVNQVPVVSDKKVTLNENRSKEIVLDAIDEEGNTLTYRLLSTPIHGTFNDGVYTPTADYVGIDSFTYIANDGTSDSAFATISIIITADFDGDDVSNELDTDDDNDGVLDTSDVFPLDSSESTDTDGDGQGNNADTDDDNDGVVDASDVFPLDSSESIDTDGDGQGNNADTDDDNDGVVDADEITLGFDPLDSSSTPIIIDTDGDGISDVEEERVGTDPLDSNSRMVTVTGTVTYDLVPSNSTNTGLDYNSIRQESVKNVKIDIVNGSNEVIETTTTNSLGEYSVSLLSNLEIKVRVYAKMIKTGTPSWDVKVVDNTNDSALYVMEGALATSGTSDSNRNLNASSGNWNGSSYTSTRVAGSFAILDSLNYAMQKVLSADAEVTFEPLVVNWSISNTTSSGSLEDGQIGTSYYTNSNLYILGDASGDTDEYDDHVVTHEWGHYYEDKFSRSDSIGGSHGASQSLDIRVAFGEGWGNAFSAMALDNPIYFDTVNNNGWNMNIEEATHTHAGWFSEGSIQRILYDLYDADHDTNGNDTMSLGFTPIHKVFIGAEKVTPAFTSIFSFISALKDENLDQTEEIDGIVLSENIASITDIFGLGRTNRASDYPYHDLIVGANVSVEISNDDGSYNKLSNRKYVRFTVSSDGEYTIVVQQINNASADPDFILYQSAPFTRLAIANSTTAGKEEKTLTLPAGDYLLDVSEYNNLSNVELTVTVNP